MSVQRGAGRVSGTRPAVFPAVWQKQLALAARDDAAVPDQPTGVPRLPPGSPYLCPARARTLAQLDTAGQLPSASSSCCSDPDRAGVARVLLSGDLADTSGLQPAAAGDEGSAP